MRTDWLRSLNSNADAAEIVETSYFENKTVTIAADRIVAVADLQTASRSAVFTGTRARIYLDDVFVDVRNDRTTILASIAAVTDRLSPTIDLTLALGEQVITIRAADVQMVETLAPDPRSEVYQGDRSRVFFSDHAHLVRHTAAAVIALLDGTASRLSNYARVSDVKANGVPGGTFLSGLWNTRDLNTIDFDDDSLLSLALNQITIIAGTFYTRITCPALRVQSNVAQLWNFDTGTTILSGTNQFSSPPGFGSNCQSEIHGVFTLSVSTVMEVQHQSFRTQVTHGFGGSVLTVAAPIPPEVYTVAEFWRIGL